MKVGTWKITFLVGLLLGGSLHGSVASFQACTAAISSLMIRIRYFFHQNIIHINDNLPKSQIPTYSYHIYIKWKLFLKEKQPPQPPKKQLFCPKHLSVPRWSSCSRPSRRLGWGRRNKKLWKKSVQKIHYIYMFIIIHDIFIFIFCIIIHHHHHLLLLLHRHRHLHHQRQCEFRPFIPKKCAMSWIQKVCVAHGSHRRSEDGRLNTFFLVVSNIFYLHP